jgi:hypothetical protein
MATSLTKIFTRKYKMLPLFFFFTSWIKKESDSGFTFLNLFLSPNVSHTTQSVICLAYRVFRLWSIPSIWIQTLFTLTQPPFFFFFTLRHPVGQLRQTRNFIIFSFAPNPRGLRDAESYWWISQLFSTTTTTQKNCNSISSLVPNLI